MFNYGITDLDFADDANNSVPNVFVFLNNEI